MPTLLQRAQSEGLSVFSISDHNSVGAYAEIKKHRHLFDGCIIPAVELSCIYNKENIEVLGYGIDTDKMARLIDENYPKIDKSENAILKNDINTLLDYGVVMDKEFVTKMTNTPWEVFDTEKGVARAYYLKEMQRHPENARFFKSEDEFLNLTEGPFARQYLFNPASALFIDRSHLMPSFDTAVEMIRMSGGLVFLAHPLIFSKNIADNLDDFNSLDGMECHYGTFTKEQKLFMCDYCDKHGLYKSGGSDYHGEEMRPQNVFARSFGEPIDFSLISDWIDKETYI